MNKRHLVSKVYGQVVERDTSFIYEGVPLSMSVERDFSFSPNNYEETELTASEAIVRDGLSRTPLGQIIYRTMGVHTYSDPSVIPLSQLFDYEVSFGSPMADQYQVGYKFRDIFNDLKESLSNVAINMFSNKNPDTGLVDVDYFCECAAYIPLVLASGVMKPQVDKDGNELFNPDGVVSVAEYINVLTAIGRTSSENKMTLDGISEAEDYFNSGYNELLSGYSSPFYSLYTRDELLKPITRCELAYLTVVCWGGFISKFDCVYSTPHELGVNLNWRSPVSYLERYVDGFNYKVSKVGDISINIKDYKSDLSMTEYRGMLCDGKKAIPYPLLMSMLEVGALGLFPYDSYLKPLREVSRGELAIFAVNLAEEFKTRYII